MRPLETFSWRVSLTALNLCLVAMAAMVLQFGPFAPIAMPGSFNADNMAMYVKARENKRIHEGRPVRIIIESLSLDLRVADGQYDYATDSWTLNNTEAFYTDLTPPLNTAAGNTLIYGHNIDAVFAKLHDVSSGTQVRVLTDNGYEFRYRYVGQADLAPHDVSLVKTSPREPILTLQTCSGNWNEYRRMFEFEFESVRRV